MGVLHLDKVGFDRVIAQSGKNVLIDCFATWCGPCQMLGPVLEEIAAAHPDLVIGKVDVDQTPEVAISLGVDSIPALFLYRDGKVVKRIIGFRNKAQLLAEIGRQ